MKNQISNKLLTIQKQLNNKMKTVSNDFKLDKGMKIWQRGIYRNGKDRAIKPCLKN